VAGQGEPHAPQVLTPGVAVVLGFVLLVGNPWLYQDIFIAVSDAESAGRFVNVLISYPRWHVDVDRAGPFLFWFANLRTVLFAALAVAGLLRVSRWVGESASGVALFVVTVGMTTLSAVAAGLASAAVALTLLDSRAVLPFFSPDRPEEFFLSQLGASASFGVLFGLVLGAVVAVRHRNPAGRERRVNAPKSFW
jgi:hypothetical protein